LPALLRKPRNFSRSIFLLEFRGFCVQCCGFPPFLFALFAHMTYNKNQALIGKTS
jgi:hypothetical protein